MNMFRRNRQAPISDLQPSDPQIFAQQAQQLIPAEVRMISGCHSEQTSADVSNVNCVGGKLPEPAGRAGGACTSALLSILYAKQDQKLSFQQLLLELRQSLARSGFSQIPQLTSSRPLEIGETPVTFVGGTGTCRALLVGINYRGQNGQLSGCQNDVLNMKKYLMKTQGYREEHILVMVDDGRHHYPTREKIIRALRQLVAQSVAGDSVYFHYSGHGGLLTPEWNVFKTKQKEYDETLYPLDHARAGQIRDFSLFNHFVKPMPAGVTVTCVMDCCHSGSVLDLPYSFQPTGAGTIRMRQSMDNLSNLAFLYILAGGMLPGGFGDVTNIIEDVTGGNIDSFQGTGLDEMNYDTDAADFDPGDMVDVGGVDDVGGVGDIAEGVDVGDAADVGGSGFPGDVADTMASGDGFDQPDFGGLGDAAPDIDVEDVDCSCMGDIIGALLEDCDN